MMSMNLSNISILNIHGFDYRYIINGISDLLKNADLSKKSGTI